MKIQFTHETADQFNYIVTLNGHDFKYSTGKGWVDPKTKRRRAPTEADVLECLYTDVQAGQCSFSEFCDNFGYDNDSISALNIYRACEDTARKFRGYKFPDSIVNPE